MRASFDESCRECGIALLCVLRDIPPWPWLRGGAEGSRQRLRTRATGRAVKQSDDRGTRRTDADSRQTAGREQQRGHAMRGMHALWKIASPTASKKVTDAGSETPLQFETDIFWRLFSPHECHHHRPCCVCEWLRIGVMSDKADETCASKHKKGGQAAARRDAQRKQDKKLALGVEGTGQYLEEKERERQRGKREEETETADTRADI